MIVQKPDFSDVFNPASMKLTLVKLSDELQTNSAIHNILAEYNPKGDNIAAAFGRISKTTRAKYYTNHNTEDNVIEFRRSTVFDKDKYVIGVEREATYRSTNHRYCYDFTDSFKIYVQIIDTRLGRIGIYKNYEIFTMESPFVKYVPGMDFDAFLLTEVMSAFNHRAMNGDNCFQEKFLERKKFYAELTAIGGRF